MSRDLAVYARAGRVVPLDDVLAHLAGHGRPARWRSLLGDTDTVRWRMGRLVPDGAGTGATEVGLSHEIADDALRAEAVAAYRPAAAGPLRAYLASAGVVYRLSAPDTPAAASFLTAAADAVATLTDGVVVDQATGEAHRPGSGPEGPP
jgi:hypothetical protein